MLFGALAGSLLTPPPANAVAKEIVELQQQVQQLLQGQQDMRTALDANSATIKTLVQQSLDGVNQVNHQMGTLQQTVQQVQANTGNSIDSMTQSTQGLSGNLQDIRALVVKLQQQLGDVQNHLQSIDAKISTAPGAAAPGGAPTGAGGTGGDAANAAPSATPPIAPATLYSNALRDFETGKYDLARQEFSDYAKNFPNDDLASNAQFYLGEVAYQQKNYTDAIAAYDNVLTDYPKSFKAGDSLYKKALSELALKMHAAGIRDLHDVVRRFPGTEDAQRAQEKLREEAAATPRTRSAQR